MAEQDKKTMNGALMPLAGLLAWLVPGAGHWLIGQRTRGTIILITVWTTFLLGLLLGGIEIVSPKDSSAWFAAQSLTGLPGLACALIQNPDIKTGYGRGVDLGQVYTGVAGLLNLICVMDVLMRCQRIKDKTANDEKG